MRTSKPSGNSPPPALFSDLLGSADWSQLAPAVQRMHGGDALLQAHGHALVEGATHLPARFLRHLLGLPEPGADRPLMLVIKRHDDRETWTRHFPGRRMQSTLQRHASTQLREQLGPVSLHFSLRREHDAIDWQLVGADER